MYEQSLQSVTSQGHPQMDRLGCPIEMEPKTLNEGELSNAREAAVEIIQTKVAKEASTIFTQVNLVEANCSSWSFRSMHADTNEVPLNSLFILQGKKAVKTAEQMRKEIEKRDQLEKLVGEGEGSGVRRGSWDLPCTDDEISDGITSREPLSSPF
ncbi:hypothetical protein C4D60_Mb10t09140 [Musa balbisiana]|uniref:Uncharacterized protein n=1 Tax=Musa balbisiana TaxID=52838 RepID=A0A4S8IVV3_MUSBA|nr:hypothetical protein C4D60_Mb10t09140 [Musa balbisiana]